ncbi:Coiled-coil domain-containing mitochondrial isoform B [Chlorella sorokiniana]|uniref:Coiled-coil domain-containing mitochondrial isoform B n=1 Tax=Chlorella sorokiniana TaxID=3076 RepID=A0A2P6U3I8_CHLSO|nr:Coiled-coil domain-containing mitochondrial isoform B [Chlorella sorokiniana]|eukprot:PRW60876.1 Coiled-coil domain-containing mitochondrial isoform B [Chlorella sorokiniana]
MDSIVLDNWIHEHLPAAIRLAEELRQSGTDGQFVFMAHSWIISLALDCPSDIGIRCPSAAEVEALEAAIRQGVITWHAMPNIPQVEMFDEGLLRAAVRLTHNLDARFGFPPKLTMNQRDVPGFSRLAIPILHSEGVRAVTVCVNGVTSPPAVPHNQPFWYRDEASGTQLLSFWHPGGYTGDPVDNADECIHAPGLKHRLCLSWTNDNAGAKVICSGLDEFVTHLLEIAPRLDLPVVQSEIGDTWIYGVASDPRKVAEYRELMRWRQAALPRYGTASLARFDQLFLKLPEHTWGVNMQHLGPDIVGYDAPA